MVLFNSIMRVILDPILETSSERAKAPCDEVGDKPWAAAATKTATVVVAALKGRMVNVFIRIINLPSPKEERSLCLAFEVARTT